MTSPLREIPAVHRFTDDPEIALYDRALGHGGVRTQVQAVLSQARDAAHHGAASADFPALRDAVLDRLRHELSQTLLGVVNGTGILLHTNLGRAPLPQSALAEAAALGGGYTNLEYDLESGERGSRYERVSPLVRELSGAEATLVVNNCAAAVLLVLDTFARGREVVVSRGELIEIGGGFRLPDVLRKSGATLVEAGTTNKTYLSDYRNAWGENTAMFMRTHPSNYRVVGFSHEVEPKALAALARELGVIAFEDLGSGAFIDLGAFGLPHEPTVPESIAAGFDLVAVSGDKLLGGPQCGIICGSAECVERLKRNSLLRALRVDKLTLAALASTLSLYLEPSRLEEIPLFAMLASTVESLWARAAAICAAVQEPECGAAVEPCLCEAATGGGTLPLARIPSAGIAVRTDASHARRRGPDRLAADLRRHSPPVIAKIEDDALIVDLRTVQRREDELVVDALRAALKPAATSANA
jgi:L-seryl-tRNA(Ser) seleniumtransferase